MGRPAKLADAEVLDRATDLLWREGCDAVSIRDLEVALTLRAPSIYRRFGSRDRLIARCVDRYVERVVRGRVRRHLEAADDPIEGLRSFFTSALDPFPGERGSRGCLLTTTSGQVAARAPEIRAALTTGFDAILVAFRTALTRGRDRGALAPDTDVDALARRLLMAFEGLLVLARAGAPELHASIDATFADFVTAR
jgi:AcrR family transcriptional regulator